ncbi:MAG: 23S rRNA (uracil(1939)-C(5))-methyltransferase RlmD [Bacteroidales bacterium]|nr:23S rRNA (uracil(1939)-C(5))-methyltransferase RlmD [Bacteroidales bacterium]
MARKKKQWPLMQGVEVGPAAAEGNAVVRIDDMVVFVPKVVPGDIIDLQITRSKRNYAEGRAERIVSPSSLRVAPLCPHNDHCGGCRWQAMRYDAQLQAKQQQVRDNLERLGQVDCSTMRPICGSDNIECYRNKLEFTFSTRSWLTREQISQGQQPHPWGALGFHVPGMFDKVIDITHCALQPKPSNAIRNAVRQYAIEHNLAPYDQRQHTGLLRNLVIRTASTGHLMVILIVAQNAPEQVLPLLEMLKNEFPEITSLQYIINTKLNDSYADLDVITYHGSAHIEEQMLNYSRTSSLRFTINPKSFYQTNSQQAQRLYSFVAELCEAQPSDTIYDLYTGAGTIALFMANQCKKVVGIEYVEEAVADARANSRLNGFNNTTFYAGDMAQVLTPDFIANNGQPDIIIADPPRAGMHPKVIEQIIAARPRRLVYVSCNPATQARDLQLLQPYFTVACIQPVDMFPHTQHVENIVQLNLK